jgi:hypothetical protein
MNEKLSLKEVVRLWTAWGDLFEAAPREPMDDDTGKLFISATFQELAGPSSENLKDLEQECRKDFGYNVFLDRAESLDLKITTYAGIFIASLCQSPGEAVMWAHGLRAQQIKKNLPEIDMGVLSEIFPFGFPTREGLNSVWDNQKGHFLGVPVDNLLDVVDAKVLEEGGLVTK